MQDTYSSQASAVNNALPASAALELKRAHPAQCALPEFSTAAGSRWMRSCESCCLRWVPVATAAHVCCAVQLTCCGRWQTPCSRQPMWSSRSQSASRAASSSRWAGRQTGNQAVGCMQVLIPAQWCARLPALVTWPAAPAERVLFCCYLEV